MKKLKILLFIIILGCLGTIGYQNLAYFQTNMGLKIEITLLEKTYFEYTARALPNWAYWGICFGAGLLIAAFKGMVKAFGLGREVKAKTLRIDALKSELNELKTELDVYIHDPYIKQHLAKKAEEAKAAKEAAEKNEADAEMVEDAADEVKDAEKEETQEVKEADKKEE